MSTITHQQMIKNIEGSFAIENITLGEKSLSNLERLANGSISIKNLVEEITERYSKESV